MASETHFVRIGTFLLNGKTLFYIYFANTYNPIYRVYNKYKIYVKIYICYVY